MDTNRDPWFWRSMAEKASVAAGGLTDRELRLQMLVIAAAYLAMAKRAQVITVSPAYRRSGFPPQPANTNQAA